MSDFFIQYYNWLSGLFNAVSPGIRGLAESLNLPLLSVLLFGLLGTLAPCQLSTNVAALAFFSRELDRPQRLWGQALAYLAGKMTVYILVGSFVVLLSLQINQLKDFAIPLIVLMRRALGPLLILVGLFMLGWLRLPLAFGGQFSAWLESKVGQRQGLLPAYLLGLAFAFSFCPTLFWLFFGLTIPLAIASPGGIVFPAVFAFGTVLPVLLLAALMSSELIKPGQLIQRFKRVHLWIERAVGLIFVLIGLHELILYWLI